MEQRSTVGRGARVRFVIGACLLWQASPALAQQTNAPNPPATEINISATTDQTVSTEDDTTKTRVGLIEIYMPADFAVFQPETASDMVAQIPGFTLDNGGSQRGFGEASSNLLVNGRRPSTKSQSARDILQQIPADSVKRIELLDGASQDIPGLTGQIINVVFSAVDLSGSWDYAARFEEGTDPQVLEGGFVLSGSRGDLGFSLAIRNGQFTFTEDGTETFRDGNGTLIENRLEEIDFKQIQPNGRLNLTWTPTTGRLAGHVGNLNLSAFDLNRDVSISEDFTAVTPAGETGTSLADRTRDDRGYEASADYAVPFGKGQLKLIGLFNTRDSYNETVFTETLAGQPTSTATFTSDEQTDEIIGRAEYQFKAGDAHDIQISGEYAFNELDATVGFEDDATAFSETDTRVQENRYDARLTDSWLINPSLSLQTSVGAEFSRLQVVVPESEAREFFRPKGFVAISYQQSRLWAMRGRLERGVGQLNFGDFISSRSLVDDRVNSGNDRIKPDQFWELSAELERTDDKLISGTLRPFIRFIEDPIDQVQFEDGSEGPGNLDSALLYGLELNGTLLMEQFGIPGMRVEFDGEIFDSEINDPLSGTIRQINGIREWEYDVEVRYDIPQSDFALTAEIENQRETKVFRFDEIRDAFVRRPFLSLGVIHKDFFGLQLEVTASNLLDNVITRDRTVFDGPDLRLGDPGRFERFERRRGRRLSFEISGTF